MQVSSVIIAQGWKIKIDKFSEQKNSNNEELLSDEIKFSNLQPIRQNDIRIHGSNIEMIDSRVFGPEK